MVFHSIPLRISIFWINPNASSWKMQSSPLSSFMQIGPSKLASKWESHLWVWARELVVLSIRLNLHPAGFPNKELRNNMSMLFMRHSIKINILIIHHSIFVFKKRLSLFQTTVVQHQANFKTLVEKLGISSLRGINSICWRGLGISKGLTGDLLWGSNGYVGQFFLAITDFPKPYLSMISLVLELSS